MEFDSAQETVFDTRKDVNIPFPIVPDETREMLSRKELLDYKEKRKKFAKWLLTEGKDIEKINGYSPDTAKRTMYRIGFAERQLWNEHQRYIPILQHDHANQYIEALAGLDKSQSHKHSCLYSLKRYFKWRHHEFGEDEWEPARTFDTNGTQRPQEFFKKQERFALRDAALRIGTIPAYNTVRADGERLERLKPYVAECVNKSVENVNVEDWDGVESWKLTSIIWASLDAGFRPDEVGNARVGWFDPDNNCFNIPRDESSKNDGNWNVALRDKTARALKEWIHEREHYPKYDDTDALWLTTHNGPYNSSSLRNLLYRVCEEAGITTENRKVSWYSIRHSVGTYLTDDKTLSATKEQLRHKRAETTMKYDGVPLEHREEALERMG